MATTINAGIAVAGPNVGAGGWYDNGQFLAIPAQTVTSAVLQMAQIIPQAEVEMSGGQPAPDFLPSATPIMRLTGAQIVFLANFSAQSTLTIGVTVYRAGTQLGGGPAFGWVYGTAGTPAFTAQTSVILPALPLSNTALVKSGAGYYLNLYPGDTVNWVVVSSGSVALTACNGQVQVI